MELAKDNFSIKKIADIIFWIGIVLEFVVSFSGYAYGGYHEPLIIVAAMGCFSLKILLSIDFKNLKSFIKQEAVWYVLILGYGCICFITQGSALVLRIGLLLIAGRDKRAKDVIKVFFWGTLGVMLITAALSAAGLHNEFSITDLFRHVPETRYCFGFYHPNGFALFLVRAILMGIYLYAEKVSWWVSLISAMIVIPVMVLVNSKMAYACVAVIVLMAIIIRLCRVNNADVTQGEPVKDEVVEAGIKDGNERTLVRLIYVSGIVIMISELVAIAVYCVNYSHISDVLMGEDNIWYYINAVTSGRLYNAASIWNEGLPTLLGVKNLANGTEIGFFNAMYAQGIVFIVIYLFVQFGLYIRSYKRRDYYAMLLVLGFAIYSLAEAFIPYSNKDAVWMLLIGIMM